LSYLTGTATITAAATTLTSTVPLSTTVGTSMTPSAILSSSASACQTGQPVTFTLDKSPVTGVTGGYPLGSASTDPTGVAKAPSVATTGWQPTAYTLTAIYPGDGNCSGSTASAPLTISAPGQALAGAGVYAVPGAGSVTFGLVVTRFPFATGATYVGGISLVEAGEWNFEGCVTSYLKASATQGSIGGVGTLSWWNPALNHNRGGWVVARTNVPYTAAFTASTSRSAGAFGAHLSYTPMGAQPPVLPNSGPVSLTRGVIGMG
jgi:hypothetical protein